MPACVLRGVVAAYGTRATETEHHGEYPAEIHGHEGDPSRGRGQMFKLTCHQIAYMQPPRSSQPSDGKAWLCQDCRCTRNQSDGLPEP